MSVYRLVISLSLLFAPVSDNLAQASSQAPIRFEHLKSATPGENSALSGECDGTAASPEVTCRFTQITVRYQLNPSKLSSELDARLLQLRREVAKDPKTFAESMCGELRKSPAEVERKLREIQNPKSRAVVQDLLSACAKPSLLAFETLIRKTTIAESKTCKVSVFQNDPVTFRRVTPNKWVANVGPHGMCSSIYLYTMERDRTDGVLWKWSQVRTYADKSGELCKDLQLNYKIEYSWQGEDPDLECESVAFGL